VQIIIENTDVMPHNFVVVNPGARATLGPATLNMAPDALDAEARPFVPRSTDVIAATRLIEPGQSATLKFVAPVKEGDYEFFCSYPNHWENMWGTLVVTKDIDAYLLANPTPPAPAATGAAHNHEVVP